ARVTTGVLAAVQEPPAPEAFVAALLLAEQAAAIRPRTARAVRGRDVERRRIRTPFDRTDPAQHGTVASGSVSGWSGQPTDVGFGLRCVRSTQGRRGLRVDRSTQRRAQGYTRADVRCQRPKV